MAYIQSTNPIVGQQQNRIKTVWALVRTIVRQVVDHRSIRRDLMHLSKQDLKDVGVTQSDIQSSATMPLSVDIATELSIRANGRSRSR